MKYLCALLVDSNKPRQKRLADALSMMHLKSTCASSLTIAQKKLTEIRYGALVIYESIAEKLLEDFCTSARDDDPGLTIMALSRSGSALDEVRLFDVGVDDIVGDMTAVEIVAKRIHLRVLARNHIRGSSGTMHIGNVCIDLDNLEVWREGKILPISRGLVDLLCYFMECRGKTISRQGITETLWQNSVSDPEGKNLDMQVSKLRRLIEGDPKRPQIIQTVRGRGYRFVH